MSLLIIIKPSLKIQREKSLEWLISTCKKRRLRYAIFSTTGSFEQDCAQIKLLLAKFNQAVVLGGDGTLHLAVNALVGSHCSLALLPCGTGNDFSRGFNCQFSDWQQALFSPPTAIDIGKVNTRYFINIAGIGLDAHVVKAMNSKINFSPFEYSWTSIKALFHYQGQPLQGTFNSNAAHYQNLITVFANHQYFGGGLNIAPNANLTDGQLDCYQVRSGGLFYDLFSLIKLLFNRHQHIKSVTYNRLSCAHITTAGLLIEADGELVGETPAKISVLANAILFHKPIKKRPL